MTFDTIAEVDEVINKLEEYRSIVKWAGRDENDPQWDKETIESTRAMIRDSKEKLPAAKADMKQYFQNVVATI